MLRLFLPGRQVAELASAAEGGYRVTVRRVTIPQKVADLGAVRTCTTAKR